MLLGLPLNVTFPYMIKMVVHINSKQSSIVKREKKPILFFDCPDQGDRILKLNVTPAIMTVHLTKLAFSEA